MHERKRHLVAGAALGDLETAERRLFQAHRAVCGDCQALERELDGVLADLALTARGRRPPDGLLGSIRAAIRKAERAPGRGRAPG